MTAYLKYPNPPKFFKISSLQDVLSKTLVVRIFDLSCKVWNRNIRDKM